MRSSDQSGRSYRFANALSYIINPLILPPIGFGLILRHFGAGAAEIAALVAASLLFFTAIPLAYIVQMVRTGRAESVEVRERSARWRPLLFGVGSYFVGVVAVMIVGSTALPLIVALALLYPINTLIVALITRRWKISVHMVGLGGFISVLLFASLLVSEALPPREGSLLQLVTVLPLLALVPLLMWARVRVGAHTVGQVTAGAIFGLLLPYLELTLILWALGLI